MEYRMEGTKLRVLKALVPVDFDEGSDLVKIKLTGNENSYGRRHHLKHTVGVDQVEVELVIDLEALVKYFAPKVRKSQRGTSRGMSGMLTAKRKSVKRLREEVKQTPPPNDYEVVP